MIGKRNFFNLYLFKFFIVYFFKKTNSTFSDFNKNKTKKKLLLDLSTKIYYYSIIVISFIFFILLSLKLLIHIKFTKQYHLIYL